MIIIPTPLGDLNAVFDEEGRLSRLMFVPPALPVGGQMDNLATSIVAGKKLMKQLNAYFAGKLKEFAIPTAPVGTPFQKQVWDAVTAVPYGETATYGQIAKTLGNASLSRAVGRANATNPIFLLMPCHRIVGAKGKLTGYAGGLDRKAELLTLESGGKPSWANTLIWDV